MASSGWRCAGRRDGANGRSTRLKALQCLDCGDVVAPFANVQLPRSCICRRHAIWAVDKGRRVVVHDRRGTRDRAFLIRISNDFLKHHAETDAATIQRLIQNPSERTYFKQQRSLIVKTLIGAREDSAWADGLPSGPPLSEAPVGRRELFARLAASFLGWRG